MSAAPGPAAPAPSGPVATTVPSGPPIDPNAPRPSYLAEPPAFRWPSARPVLGMLVLFVLVGGILYPLVVDGVERGTGAWDPAGGFVVGGDPRQLAEYAIGTNITNDSLFWLRPSLTDYNTTLSSGESPYGPTDPNLVNLTEYYVAWYGFNNTTVPLDLVGNSESGLDPDLTPAAVLVQIPRVSAHTHFTQPFLTNFVMEHVTDPTLGLVGPQYVNVLILDADLLLQIRSSGLA